MKKKAEADCFKTIAESLKDDREQRKKYGGKIFLGVAIYMMIIPLIIVCDHSMSDKVKIALKGFLSKIYNLVSLLDNTL